MLKITFVTVTFNAEKTLQRTIDSVRGQTYPSIEHIIMDGMSTDHTFELVHRYMERNGREERPIEIQAAREPDNGLYDAMNKALSLATGQYVCFLNAGDVLPVNDVVERLVMSLPQVGELPGVVYGETDIVDDYGNFLYHRRLTAPVHLTWKSFRNGMRVCHQSFYVRMDIAKRERYDLQYRYSADFDWCIRVLKLVGKKRLTIHNTEMVLTNYLQEGMTTRHHKASLGERYRIMTHYYGALSTFLFHIWFVIRSIFGILQKKS